MGGCESAILSMASAISYQTHSTETNKQDSSLHHKKQEIDSSTCRETPRIYLLIIFFANLLLLTLCFSHILCTVHLFSHTSSHMSLIDKVCVL